MAWTIKTPSNPSMDIHLNSGVVTRSKDGCTDSDYYDCSSHAGSVTASLLSGSAFDNFTTVRKTITYTYGVKSCNQEWFITKFNGEGGLNDNNGFDIKLVDECDYLVYGAPLRIGNDGFSSSDHTVKYHTTNDTIRTGTITNNQNLTYLYFPHKYCSATTGSVDDFPGVNIKTIEASAFTNNPNLTSITLSCVETIGQAAFSGCTGLISIDWGDSRSNCCKCNETNAPSCKQETTIGASAFCNCTSLESLSDFNTLSRLTNLGDHAFYNCRALSALTIPSNISEIKDYTFYNCVSLSSVTIPSNITSIGAAAFYNGGLKEINIPNSVTSLGANSFANCYNATSITLSNNLTVIPNSCFANCERLTSITIPDSVETIGQVAFGKCGSNYEVENFTITIGSGVKTIGVSAFAQCRTLESINIPNNVETIGDGAFYGCGWLTSVTIGNGVETIGGLAFNSCSKLKTVTIGSGILSIGNQAFFETYDLETLTITQTQPPELGASAFVLSGITSIKVPSESVDIYKSASGWSEYAELIVPIT